MYRFECSLVVVLEYCKAIKQLDEDMKAQIVFAKGASDCSRDWETN